MKIQRKRLRRLAIIVSYKQLAAFIPLSVFQNLITIIVENYIC